MTDSNSWGIPKDDLTLNGLPSKGPSGPMTSVSGATVSSSQPVASSSDPFGLEATVSKDTTSNPINPTSSLAERLNNFGIKPKDPVALSGDLTVDPPMDNISATPSAAVTPPSPTTSLADLAKLEEEINAQKTKLDEEINKLNEKKTKLSGVLDKISSLKKDEQSLIEQAKQILQ